MRRSLRLEALEGRRLLSADCGASMALGRINEVAALVAPPQVRLSPQQDAGETLSTAARAGAIEGSRSFRGSLDAFDRVDLLAFTVERDAQVEIDLGGLRTNADLVLLDSRGRLVEFSSRPWRFSESLDVRLQAGDYYVAVVAASLWSNRYTLQIDVNLDALPTPASPPSPVFPAVPVATPPATTPPVARPPVNTPSVPPVAPEVPQPLADVAYFGTHNDWNVNQVAAPEAWGAGYQGQGVTVAIVDSGVDLDHPDLVHSLFVNPGEIPGNGLDDDQNGFIDDVHGYDFADNDNNPNDVNGHGTHVAGTIAAAHNGVGANGIAPEATILPVRVLGSNGSGSDGAVAAGIRYAADMGADIINLSLGGGYSRLIEAAVQYAESLGSFVVAAAGNDGASAPGYPARFSGQYTGVLSVGAVNANGELAAFSNRVGASRAQQIDAPGVGVYSTWSGGGYRALSGTSMAAPHVSAVAALALSANPNLTSSQLRSLLIGGAVDQARRSDSLGQLSAATTVAYAAAGLTSLPS